MKENIKDLFKDVWNVPNVLTMIRLALVPVFAAVLMAGHSLWALGIFCLASFTDCLDGIIARKCNLITSFGKLMDPLADKLLVVTALVCQGIRGVFPWIAIIIVIAKEIIMIAGSTYMFNKGIVVYANYLGKVSTVCFIVSLILSFFHAELLAASLPLDTILVWCSVVLTLCALVRYIFSGLDKVRQQK